MSRIRARTRAISLVGPFWILSLVASGCGDSGEDGTKAAIPSEATKQKFAETIKNAAKSGQYGKTATKIP